MCPRGKCPGGTCLGGFFPVTVPVMFPNYSKARCESTSICDTITPPKKNVRLKVRSMECGCTSRHLN